MGFDGSVANGTDGTRQVGYGQTATGSYHAMLWSGSAGSVIDLSALLPPTLTDAIAYTIAGNNVYGIANDANGNMHAIVWSVPEPATLTAIAGGAMLLLKRRRNT